MRLLKVRRRALAVAAVTVLLVSGGAIAYSAVVPNPDPCDSRWSASGTTNERLTKLRNYMDCRSDRIESAIPETTVTVPGPTTTVTVTAPTSSTTSPTSTTTSPTSTTSTTTTTAPPAEWPGSTNTGVPAGTTLTAYTGPCTLTAPATIDAKDVTAKCGELIVNTMNVTITRSKLPRVESTYQDGGSSVNVSDSSLSSPTWPEGVMWGYNMTATRVDITGGQHSFHCAGDCTVTDSWLHDQYNPAGQGYHNNAFITNGGSHMVVRHNTLHCTPLLNNTNGGCTADVSLFGDFGPVSDVVVDRNLLKANDSSISYCAYGGHQPSKPYPVSTQIRFTDNVFERGPNGKCGVYGPVTSFQSSADGNVWTGNVWDNGGDVQAAD